VCEINTLGCHHVPARVEIPERSAYASGMESDEKTQKCNQASPDKVVFVSLLRGLLDQTFFQVICEINQIAAPQSGIASNNAQRSDYTSGMGSDEMTLNCNRDILGPQKVSRFHTLQ